MKTPAPVTLTSPVVRLEPLTLTHVGALALARVGLDAELWRFIPTPITTPEEMHAYVATALDEQARGVSLPFAIVDAASGELVGSTRFGNIDVRNRRLEIGWTWLARSHQRTRANTAAKRLLLGHAFDALGANRVEFKTDVLNETSRNAIARIGGVQEGILRQHVACASGRLRDTVYFSILANEWAAVARRLDERLAA
ncbi:MAG: GNAT family protein [Burkholderiales bacterium]